MIAVVGGGISGLAVGHHLAAAGRDVTVLEADTRPGGVVSTVRCGDRILDIGPQRTRLTPPLRQLVDTLGLTDQLRTAPSLPLFIYTDGRLRLVPRDLASALTTDLIGWPDRLRALFEPFVPGIRHDESAGEFFTRKFGRRTYRRAIAPLFGGLYASDPEDMRARHALASMLATLGVEGSLLGALVRGGRSGPQPPACSFDGGLQTLTDALARALGERLRLKTPVHEIRGDGTRLRLLLDHQELTVDRVVLACTPAAAAALIDPLDPAAGARLARLRMNRLATVHLESHARLGAMGYQVAPDEGLATHGVTSQHDLFGRAGLYTAFLGGTGHPEIATLPDPDLAALAAAEFERVTGATARTVAVHRTAMPAWDTTWDAVDDLELPPGIHICANWWDRPGITGRLIDARRLAREIGAAAPHGTEADNGLGIALVGGFRRDSVPRPEPRFRVWPSRPSF